MALDLTALSIPLLQGLDLKTSRFLTKESRALVAQNVIQKQPGQVEKRYGFQPIVHPPQSSGNWLGVLGRGTPGSTSLGQELLIGGLVTGQGYQQHGFSPASNGWLQKGSVQPLAVTEKVAFSGTVDCQATDLALNFNTPIAGGCYSCYAYEKTPATGQTVSFCVYDDKSGQNVISDTTLQGTDPRVVSIGPWFCIFYVYNGGLNVVTINPSQRTVSVPYVLAPKSGSNQVLTYDARGVSGATIGHSGAYVAVAFVQGGTASTVGFDPWDGVPVGTITGFLLASSPSVAIGIFPSNIAVLLGGSVNMVVQWFDLNLVKQSSFTIDTTSAAGIASSTYGKGTIGQGAGGWIAFWETNAQKGTPNPAQDFTAMPAIRFNFGTIGAGSTLANGLYCKRNQSLAGDMFSLGGQTYVPTVYQGHYNSYSQMVSLQPTYFLEQLSGDVLVEVSRFAQTNAGGPTLHRRCPQVSTDLAGNIVWGIGLGTQMTGNFNGAYQSVRSVARAVFTYAVQPFSETLGDDLYLTGGCLWAYDGASFSEDNFHVTPEPPTVDVCNVGCVRVQMGVSSAGLGTRASVFVPDFNNTGSDDFTNGVLFTAVSTGASGNSIIIAVNIVNDPSIANPVTTCTVSGNLITITPGTSPNGGGTVVIGTDDQMRAAVVGNPAAAALVTPTTSTPANQVSENNSTNLLYGGSGLPVNTVATMPTHWTQQSETFSATLSPLPIQPGTLEVWDGLNSIGTDDSNGNISGSDNGNPLAGTVDYTTGLVGFTINGLSSGQQTGGAITITWSNSTPTTYREVNDVYFPPDTLNPFGTIIASGWQIRPGSYVVFTAQSNGPAPFFGPCGYVYFTVDGLGLDPQPFSAPLVAGVPCALLSTDTAVVCAQKFRQAILNSSLSEFVTVSAVVQNVNPPTGISAGATSKVTITSVLGGEWDAGCPLTYSEDLRIDPVSGGQAGLSAGSYFSFPPGHKIMPGGYFVVPLGNTTGTASVDVFYYTVNGVGQSPSASQIVLPVPSASVISIVISATIEIAIKSSYSPADVASKTLAAIAAAGGNPYPGYESILQMSTPPSFGMSAYNISCAGILPDGLYEYTSCWEWSDNKGQFHQSGTSESVLVNVQGSSPTFDPFGVPFNTTGSQQSVITQTPGGHGMLLWGSPVGGSSPYLISPSLWATQKQNSTLAFYRTTVSAGETPSFYRATDAAQTEFIGTPPANWQSTLAILNPNPISPNATETNPVTGGVTPPDIQTFIETTPDSQFQSNATLYTDGGVVQNAPVPSCSFLHVHRGRLWAVLKENPNQLWYSQVYSDEAQLGVQFSESLTVDIDPEAGDIVALGTCDAWLIVFCQYGMFAIGGDGPTAAGQGDFQPPNRIMTDTGGCIAPGSIVEQPNGLWYQSSKGLYFMDRKLEITPQGLDYNTLVNGFTCNASMIVPKTQEILWFMSAVPNAAQPSSDYALYYNPFTDFKAQHLKRAASAAVVWNQTLVWTDVQGNVNVDTPGAYLDNGAVIPFTYQTAWLGKASGVQGYLRVRRALFVGDYISPANLKVQIAYDYEPWSRQVLGSGQPTDGTRFQWRIQVPPSPRGGRIQSISFIISDYGDGGNMGGFTLSNVTLEMGVFKGGFRAGASRTTG